MAFVLNGPTRYNGIDGRTHLWISLSNDILTSVIDFQVICWQLSCYTATSEIVSYPSTCSTFRFLSSCISTYRRQSDVSACSFTRKSRTGNQWTLELTPIRRIYAPLYSLIITFSNLLFYPNVNGYMFAFLFGSCNACFRFGLRNHPHTGAQRHHFTWPNLISTKTTSLLVLFITIVILVIIIVIYFTNTWRWFLHQTRII